MLQALTSTVYYILRMYFTTNKNGVQVTEREQCSLKNRYKLLLANLEAFTDNMHGLFRQGLFYKINSF